MKDRYSITSNSDSSSIFNATFIQLFIIQILSMMTFYSLFVIIGPYAVHTYHVSTTIAGLITGMTIIGTMVARFSAGIMTAKFSAKKLTILSMIILVPILLAYQYEGRIIYLLIIRFIQGLAVGLTGTVTNTAVINVIPLARRAEGIAYFSLATILGTAFGPFLALLIEQHYSYTILFWLEFVTGVVALIASFLIDAKKVTIKATSTNKKFNLKTLIEPKVLGISLTLGFVTFGYAALQSELDFYASDLNLVTFASYFFLVYALAILVSRPLVGRLMDNKNENYVVYPALIILAIGLFILGKMSNGWMMLLAAILIGFGFGNFQSAVQSTTTQMVPADRLTQTTATYFICYEFSLGFGPSIIGFIQPMLGYQNLFIVMAVIALIGIILYYFIHGRKVSAH
ncbi:MFS transporter [Weissella paramesenteroides]|uniref:MFS transporter n=1 Tax=Weissella paramesenteroides TaxID=1249 RepID=UPI001969FC49|nr:MFS transporter [Weissella paramesenteroides]